MRRCKISFDTQLSDNGRAPRILHMLKHACYVFCILLIVFLKQLRVGYWKCKGRQCSLEKLPAIDSSYSTISLYSL
ncbi:hypothetical protein SNEBB_000892 [Seison nebaliae]|nr:hypothetical protein SNEBB_000892 [Seison nebaliae]